MAINKNYYTLAEAAAQTGCTQQDLIHLAANSQLSLCIMAKGWDVDLYYRPDDEVEWELLALPNGPHKKALGPVRVLLEDARLLEADSQVTTRSFGALLDEPAPDGFYEYRLCDDSQPDVRIADCELVVLASELKAFGRLSDEAQTDESQEHETLSTEDQEASDPNYIRPKRKAPDAFVAALIRLLVEIARRAGAKGLAFDVAQMPGQKEDLLEVAKKFDGKMFNKSPSTFDTYISGLCQFTQGAKPSSFYADLFNKDVKPTKD